jgi:glycosyltransferase involved in cell wall biosynthesis
MAIRTRRSYRPAAIRICKMTPTASVVGSQPSVAIVVQRYGANILGGAEAHARQIAERLVSAFGWDVHVYTTTAEDYLSWSRHYPPGCEILGGVTVHRFDVAMSRHMGLFKVFTHLLSLVPERARSGSLAARLRRFAEYVWLVLQGPYCPSLIAGLRRDARAYQRVFFFTYLYYPTVVGVPLLRDKAVLIPTSHDEAPFHWDICRGAFSGAPLIFANTQAEKELIQANLPAAADPRIVTVGLGVDRARSSPQAAGSAWKHELPRRYVLYLGRISLGKGVGDLLSDFQMYLQTADSNLGLVLAGIREADVPAPADSRIRMLGFVSDEQKDSLLENAACLVNPSPLESLSMVVLEALAAGIPILVNGRCDVLRAYADTLPSVFAYFDGPGFAEQLAKISSIDWQRQSKSCLEESRQWVFEHYDWSRVLEAYRAALGPDLP